MKIEIEQALSEIEEILERRIFLLRNEDNDDVILANIMGNIATTIYGELEE